MRYLEYYVGGKKKRIRLQGVTEGRQARRGRSRLAMRSLVAPQTAPNQLVQTLSAQRKRLSSRFTGLSESTTFVMPTKAVGATIIPTESVVLDGARKAEVQWAKSKLGMEIVREGRHGKTLLRVPGDAKDPVATAFKSSVELVERGRVEAAHPNFLRVVQRPGVSSVPIADQWALQNPGPPKGEFGADVHALAAWTVTEGSADVRVAVLDEGVDTLHGYLKPVVVAEADFVDGNDHARPDGDDAHGTACAGIISSQDDKVRGLAPGVRLVAARIAKSDSEGFWIFDDFETADAIDWCWDDAKSDVLSNSWGGGPAADVIIRAFERARTRGRGGKGAVVAVAAGNDQAPVDFPGNLDGVLTVGASNQWDERKTRNSRDGENWWGSNFGDELDLLAPGVGIKTTDIRGARGYDPSLVTETFNGTSSACPHAAAVAGLILSIRPDLAEARVREIINESADHLTQSGDWNRLLGHGRLNAYAALRAARKA